MGCFIYLLNSKYEYYQNSQPFKFIDRYHEYLQSAFPSEIWVFTSYEKLNPQNSKIGISKLKQRVTGSANVRDREVTRSLNTDVP
jgi:hypothetical protein